MAYRLALLALVEFLLAYVDAGTISNCCIHSSRIPLTCITVASSSQYATFRNFNPEDLLASDDGMPPSPYAPWIYGAPVSSLDTDGNVMEQHCPSIEFYEGKYYLYTEKWACGQLVFFSGLIPNVNVTAPKYAPGDYGGTCGFGIYSSDNLTTWKLERSFVPDVASPSMQKPHVLYSEATKKYVFWYKSGSNFAETNALAVMTSDSPAGPFTGSTNATGTHMGHDFDIARGPDGAHYIVSDVYSATGSTDRTKPPVWNVWVQKLNPELTGTVDTNDTMALIMADVNYEAIGFFERQGHWYITSGATCANCAVPTSYVMSSSGPFGPYENLEGDSSAGGSLKRGSLIGDGCTGQSKAITVLPGPKNESVILATSWIYRTSPSNYVKNGSLSHGNNAQAIASSAYYPLTFSSDFHVDPIQCPATVKIPLAPGLTAPNKQHPEQQTPTPYQADCRITWATSLQQTWTRKAQADIRQNQHQAELSILVWQQTTDLGPFDQGGPVNDAPLRISVEAFDGQKVETSMAASNVSWSPEKVTLDLGGLSVREVKQVSLSSEVRNGCYGVVVEPSTHGTTYGSQGINGIFRASEKAQMVVF